MVAEEDIKVEKILTDEDLIGLTSHIFLFIWDIGEDGHYVSNRLKIID